MGAKIFFLLLFALWFLGITGFLFACFLKKYLFWLRKTPVSPRQQFVLILLPSLFIAFFLCPTFVQTFKELPVPRDELKEIAAPVESVKRLTYRRTQGRYGGGCFWDYEFAAGQLWYGAMYHLITALAGLLFLGTGAVYSPPGSTR